MEYVIALLLVLNMSSFNSGFDSGKRYVEMNNSIKTEQIYQKGYTKGKEDTANRLMDLTLDVLGEINVSEK